MPGVAEGARLDGAGCAAIFDEGTGTFCHGSRGALGGWGVARHLEVGDGVGQRVRGWDVPRKRKRRVWSCHLACEAAAGAVGEGAAVRAGPAGSPRLPPRTRPRQAAPPRGAASAPAVPRPPLGKVPLPQVRAGPARGQAAPSFTSAAQVSPRRGSLPGLAAVLGGPDGSAAAARRARRRRRWGPSRPEPPGKTDMADSLSWELGVCTG